MDSPLTVTNSGWEMDHRPVDVVVISSQVAYGSVGIGAVAPVITRAGYRCIQVPTALLGTLPHYPDVHAPSVHGGAIPDEQLAAVLDDLVRVEALNAVRYVLVGYLANARQARIVAEWMTRLQEHVVGVKLVIDPAMGDDDVGMYTGRDVVDAYLTSLVPLAAGLTPNRFEVSLLSGREITAHDELHDSAAQLCPDGGWVVVTSTTMTDDRIETMVVDARGASTIDHPYVSTAVKGAGDVFAGGLLADLLAGKQVRDAAAEAGDLVVDRITQAGAR